MCQPLDSFPIASLCGRNVFPAEATTADSNLFFLPYRPQPYLVRPLFILLHTLLISRYTNGLASPGVGALFLQVQLPMANCSVCFCHKWLQRPLVFPYATDHNSRLVGLLVVPYNRFVAPLSRPFTAILAILEARQVQIVIARTGKTLYGIPSIFVSGSCALFSRQAASPPVNNTFLCASTTVSAIAATILR